MKSAIARLSAFLALLCACAGCENKPPPIYEVKGKVTLGGKAYPRLLVYFRPASGEVNQFNFAVGETDKDGMLVVRSNIGAGVPTGEYKVTFTCKVPKQKTAAADKLTSEDKPSELGLTMIELVPDSHSEGKGIETTPVRFTVTSGENVFNFDIPAK